MLMYKFTKLIVLLSFLSLISTVGAWNDSYNNRIGFNISNPSASTHPYEVILLNFTGTIGGECQNDTLVIGTQAGAENQTAFGLVTNTSNSCTVMLIYNTTASQNGNNTVGYFYFNISGTTGTNTVLNRFGVLQYLTDYFDYATWNNTRWGMGVLGAGDYVVLNTSTETADITGNGIDFGANFYNNITNVNFTRPISINAYFRIIAGANLDIGLDNSTIPPAPNYLDNHFKGELYQSGSHYHYEGTNEIYNEAFGLSNNVWYSWTANGNATSICSNCGSYFFFDGAETTSILNSSNVTGSSFLENARFGGSSGLKQVDNITIINGTGRWYKIPAVVYFSPPQPNISGGGGGSNVTRNLTRNSCLDNQTLEENITQNIYFNGSLINQIGRAHV